MPSIAAEKEIIDQLLMAESVARAASVSATSTVEQDERYIEAERFADRAWSLAETNDHAFVVSDIWR